MWVPAVNEAIVQPELISALRAFLIERPEWIGRIQWWYEGESEHIGTLRIKFIYPTGTHSSKRECKTDKPQEAKNWLHRELYEHCLVKVWEDASLSD